MKGKIDDNDNGGVEQGQPTTKKARLSIVRETSQRETSQTTSPCCDFRPPPLVLDLDADLNRTIVFDSGKSVVVDHQIEEGGFGAIFVARETSWTNKKRKHIESVPFDCSTKKTTTPTTYALKRIDCCNSSGQTDQEKIDMCSREANLHSTFHHKNLMRISGIKFISDQKTKTSCTIKTCYMLFPYIPKSIRSDISARRLLEDTKECNRRPYSESEALDLFAGIADGVRTIHEYGYSHRDLKVENILLQELCGGGPGVPVITDFGSAGPISTPLTYHSDVLRVEDEVTKYTSIEYRAPELLDPKGLPHGPREILDYGRCDVWALGCVFFAMMYGSSPFEIEWGISFVGKAADGTARLTICSPNLIRGKVPFPPDGSAADRRYGKEFRELIECILNQDRFERLSSQNVYGRVQKMLEQVDK